MTERSRPWSGTVTGDAGPYTDDNWTRVWASVMAPVIASEGVLWDQTNELAASGIVTPVSIDTGRAFVDGSWYESDASVSVAIPTPAANPRIDRIVLRKDFVLQTIRITRIAGAEGASPSPPAITQTVGVTWDLPLWQIHVTVGAVVTVYADEREFVGQYTPSGLSSSRFYDEDDLMGTRGDSNSVMTKLFYQENSANSLGFVPDSPNPGVVATRARVAGSSNGHWLQTETVGFDFPPLRPIAQEVDLSILARTPATDPLVTGRLGMFTVFPTIATPDPAEGIYFRQIGAGNWFTVTRTGAAETATDTGIAQSGTYRTFRMRCRAGIVNFYIDDVLVVTHTTNIVAAAEPLAIMFGHTASAAPAGDTDQVECDYVRVGGLRP